MNSRKHLVLVALVASCVLAISLPGVAGVSGPPAPGKGGLIPHLGEGPVSRDFDLGAWERTGLQALANCPPAESDPPIDVLHYDLDLSFDLTGATVNGTATITLIWQSQPDNILRVESLRVELASDVVPGAPVETFDVRGRKVREVSSTPRTLEWDGRDAGDAGGRPAVPGTYSLRTRGKRKAVRVVLLPGAR